jgi:hypothetical protein
MEWIFGLFELFFVYEAYFLVGEFFVELLGLRVLFLLLYLIFCLCLVWALVWYFDTGP